MALESITGRLIDIYPQFQPETIQHAHQIQAQRRGNSTLKNQWFWTADFSMYATEGKEPVLYMADREHNLLFQNIEEAVKQIRETQNYKPTEEGVKSVLLAAQQGLALKTAHSELGLTRYDDKFSFYEINTRKPEKLKSEQAKLARRVHGRTDSDFVANMEMLGNSGIEKTRIYVLNPKYVIAHTKDGAIARASWLNIFGNNSNFGAGSRSIDNSSGCLRGVRKVAEGDVAKKQEPQSEASLENKLNQEISAALAEGKAFSYNGLLYVPTQAPNLEIKR